MGFTKSFELFHFCSTIQRFLLDGICQKKYGFFFIF